MEINGKKWKTSLGEVGRGGNKGEESIKKVMGMLGRGRETRGGRGKGMAAASTL